MPGPDQFNWPVGADDPQMAARLNEIRRLGRAFKQAKAQNDKVGAAASEMLLRHAQIDAERLFNQMTDQLAEYKAGFESISIFLVGLMQHAGISEGDAINLPKPLLDAIPRGTQVQMSVENGQVHFRYKRPGEEMGKVDLRGKDG